MALTDEELKTLIAKLKENNVIIPKWVLGVWTGAVAFVLIGVGITGFVGFRDTVTALAREAATKTATTVSTEVANDIAKSTAEATAGRRAEQAVNLVFDSALSSAKSAAAASAQKVAEDLVLAEASKAAEDAVKTWLKSHAGGEDIVSFLQQKKTEADAIVTHLHIVEKNVNGLTLAGVSARVDALYVRAGAVDLELDHIGQTGDGIWNYIWNYGKRQVEPDKDTVLKWQQYHTWMTSMPTGARNRIADGK